MKDGGVWYTIRGHILKGRVQEIGKGEGWGVHYTIRGHLMIGRVEEKDMGMHYTFHASNHCP